MTTLLRDIMAVSRPEYLAVGALFAVAYGSLATGSWPRLADNLAVVALGGVLGCLSHLLGSQVNCLADRDLDRRHKSRLAAAVARIEARRLWLIFAGESVVAAAVSVAVARLTAKPELVALWAAGWLLAVAYSVEPLRLKRRGFLNPLALLAAIYLLPLAFGYLALNDRIDPPTLVLMAAIGLQMFSLFLMNEVEDLPEDSASAILTPCVRLGVRAVALLALVGLAVGTMAAVAVFVAEIRPAGLAWGFAWIYGLGLTVVWRDVAEVRLRATPEAIAADFEPVRRVAERNKWHFLGLGSLTAAGALLTLF